MEKKTLADEMLDQIDIEDVMSRKEQSYQKEEAPPQPKTNHHYNQQPKYEGGRDWKNINMEILASQGIMYDFGVEIKIRPASLADILSFSNMNENDYKDTNARINILFEKCLRITGPNKVYVTKDLCLKDKMGVIFSIRDYTFSEFPNELIQSCKCPECKKDNQVALNGLNTVFFEPSEVFKKNYNPERKSIYFRTSDGEELDFYFPTIGVAEAIQEYQLERAQYGKVDHDYLRFVPYITKDWRTLTYESISRMLVDMNKWGLEKTSLLIQLIDEYEASSMNSVIMDCNHCGALGVSANFQFPGKLKHIFLIPNVLGKFV